jgi:2-succinyl-6-hydroxy-2,4-cyclohexadiene-1-carboxylate synthase
VPERVVLLHGFGGTRHAWDGVAARLRPERYLPLALDLPGHGTMAGERPITFAGCVAHVLARAPARFALCGYSLGGRVALHVALAAPRRVTRLVLV